VTNETLHFRERSSTLQVWHLKYKVLIQIQPLRLKWYNTIHYTVTWQQAKTH